MKSINSIRNDYPANLDRRELDILLAEAIDKDEEFVLAHPEYQLNFWQRQKFFFFLNKCRLGYPLAYIVGHKEFFGLDFFVNKHVLIPRPETELIVEEARRIISNFQSSISNQFSKSNDQIFLIDIGSGSGCIPIAIIKATGNDKIRTLAVDISRRALRVARKNAKKYGVDIKFFYGDLLEPIIKTLEHENIKAIIITANLPYLTGAQFKSEPTIQHEPKSALVSDNKNGLKIYERLFSQITRFLKLGTFHPVKSGEAGLPRNCGAEFNGVNLELLVEIDPRQSGAAYELAKKYFPQSDIEIKKDLALRDRVVRISITN